MAMQRTAFCSVGCKSSRYLITDTQSRHRTAAKHALCVLTLTQHYLELISAPDHQCALKQPSHCCQACIQQTCHFAAPMLHGPARIGARDQPSVRTTARHARQWAQQRGKCSTNTSRRVATQCALSDQQLMVKRSVAAGTGRLDLSECQLEAVPDGLCDVTSLEDLSLAGNRIEQLPEAVGQLQELRRLVVAGNRLQGLPEGLGLLPELEGLWAHGNLLQDLPGSLGGATALKTLALAGGWRGCWAGAVLSYATGVVCAGTKQCTCMCYHVGSR